GASWRRGVKEHPIKEESRMRVATAIGESDWTAQIAIPLALLRFSPAQAEQWLFNVVRNRKIEANSYTGLASSVSSFSPVPGRYSLDLSLTPAQVENLDVSRYLWDVRLAGPCGYIAAVRNIC